MFDILIRELAARFGTGEQSQLLLRIVLAYMTNKETGGLIGFLEQFKKAGLGPVIQSWLGNTVSPKPLTNTQVESVLGGSGSLLDLLSRQVNAPRDNLAGAVAYLLPALVAKLTPGGSIPNHLPAEVASLIGETQPLLSIPPEVSQGSGAMGKWLPLLIGGVVVVGALAYCSQQPANDTGTVPAGGVSVPVEPASGAASDAVSKSASEVASVAPVEAPVASEAAFSPASEASAAMASGLTELASVASVTVEGVPRLMVFFETAKRDVPQEFAPQATVLVAYLQEHASAKAVVSGYNDASGDPELNAQLSKARAEAVRDALLAQGVAADRIVLEKPAEPTAGAGDSARRVDVVIRP